ncbi:FAD-dependent monooxygenase [Actinomadura fibrosa]|uniref:FAD-dependent monooxygenase n=1 Tax=Actinomadura fibrosa TaxID=111802 RepID=A0ABW2Y5V1_9ACTN|nr:FAD-dependent monooxygenase [Actinomadura fibrosa]
MDALDVPVLVVGGGPVGMATGMFLAHWGAAPMVIEKRDAISPVPRAGTSLRTLEILRAVGLGAAVQEAGRLGGPPMRAVFKDSGLGATLHRTGLPERHTRLLETCSPVDARLILTQDQVQRLALDELRRLGGQVRFGTRLVGLACEDDHVRARVVDAATGREQQIRAAYLVGADGANSDVRGLLGITVPDREVIARLNTVFFRARLGPLTQEWGTHMCFVRNEAVYATLISKDGRDRWSSHIMDYPGKPEGLTELTEARTLELLRAAIGDDTVPIDIEAANAWEAATGMASAFRKGRALLAGDAAHVQSSAGGLGMNTGIQDGHNLAWKIAAVLDGSFAPALLDTYEPERRAAARASLALSRGMHRGYQALDGAPDDLYEKIAADYLRGMMFYGYPPHDGDHDVLDDAIRTGHRFPHRWLGSPGTGRVSTLDRAASRWTLFTPPGGHGEPPAGLGLQVHDLPGLDGAVLVRPDGFVAWHGTARDGYLPALRDLGLRTG